LEFHVWQWQHRTFLLLCWCSLFESNANEFLFCWFSLMISQSLVRPKTDLEASCNLQLRRINVKRKGAVVCYSTLIIGKKQF
jgi:hypothetical protein